MYYRTREDDGWRYQTTSSQYGQFYKAMERETQRDKEYHTNCNIQVTQLTERLDEAKACLEMVSLGGPLASQKPYGPRGPCCFEASAQGRRCPCRQKQPGCENPYSLNSLEAWNCGQNPEPQFLEDHVNCYHRRLAQKPLIPKITFGYASKDWGGCFGTGGKQRSIHSSPPAVRSSFYSNRCGGTPQYKGTSVLPNTSRYGFYRYYGLAGQGAKTSKGYYPRP